MKIIESFDKHSILLNLTEQNKKQEALQAAF